MTKYIQTVDAMQFTGSKVAVDEFIQKIAPDIDTQDFMDSLDKVPAGMWIIVDANYVILYCPDDLFHKLFSRAH